MKRGGAHSLAQCTFSERALRTIRNVLLAKGRVSKKLNECDRRTAVPENPEFAYEKAEITFGERPKIQRC
jgi:hypothetical protein